MYSRPAAGSPGRGGLDRHSPLPGRRGFAIARERSLEWQTNALRSVMRNQGRFTTRKDFRVTAILGRRTCERDRRAFVVPEQRYQDPDGLRQVHSGTESGQIG